MLYSDDDEDENGQNFVCDEFLSVLTRKFQMEPYFHSLTLTFVCKTCWSTLNSLIFNSMHQQNYKIHHKMYTHKQHTKA